MGRSAENITNQQRTTERRKMKGRLAPWTRKPEAFGNATMQSLLSLSRTGEGVCLLVSVTELGLGAVDSWLASYAPRTKQ